MWKQFNKVVLIWDWGHLKIWPELEDSFPSWWQEALLPTMGSTFPWVSFTPCYLALLRGRNLRANQKTTVLFMIQTCKSYTCRFFHILQKRSYWAQPEEFRFCSSKINILTLLIFWDKVLLCYVDQASLDLRWPILALNSAMCWDYRHELAYLTIY